MSPYFFQYSFKVLEHFVVPKPDNPVTLNRKPLVSFQIAFSLLDVLSSVKLYYKFILQANKVDNKFPNPLLSSEFISFQLFPAKIFP